MANITFTRGDGAIGAEPASLDHVSGFIFHTTTSIESDAPTRIYTLKELEDLTSFSSATHNVLHYHIREYYAMRQKLTGKAQGELWLMTGDYSLGFDGSDLQTLQDASGGRCRQIGVWLGITFATSMVTGSQTYAETNATNNKPHSVLLAADISGTAAGSLDDLLALDSENVSVVAGEDFAGRGAELWASEGVTISMLGAVLGCVSASGVHENIGWRGKFEVTHSAAKSDGFTGSIVTEYDEVTISASDIGGAGTPIKPTDAQVTAVSALGYILGVKEIGLNGTFFNDSYTCTTGTSDYAYIERQRTMDKAVREVRAALLPKLSGPLYLDASTGKLSKASIEEYKSAAFNGLEVLANREEISVDENGLLPAASVTIDPDQDILGTSKIVVGIAVVPVGVARTIEVNISFAVSV